MTDNAFVTHRSEFSFDATLLRLQAQFTDKGITIFSIIDHHAAAQEADLSMPPATVIIFGNPKAGTPLMRANLEVAVDLPLKVLVSEPEPGKVLVSYRTAADIGKVHAIPDDLISNLAKAENIIKNAIVA